MATRAIRTAHAPVDIVLCVAGDTLAGRARPTLPGMTGKASGCAVPAGELRGGHLLALAGLALVAWRWWRGRRLLVVPMLLVLLAPAAVLARQVPLTGHSAARGAEVWRNGAWVVLRVDGRARDERVLEGLRRLVPVLARYNLPAPVLGGLAVAVAVAAASGAGGGVGSCCCCGAASGKGAATATASGFLRPISTSNSERMPSAWI